MRDFAPIMGLGLQLALSVVAFFLLGWWADTSWGWSPWGRLAGVMIGATGGMIKFIRTVTGPGFKDGPRTPHAD